MKIEGMKAMLHNSLLIRDFLKARNADPVCIERRAVHARAGKMPLPNEDLDFVTLSGNWEIVVDPAIIGAREIQLDMADFLEKCGVSIIPGSPGKVILSIDPSIPRGAYRIAASGKTIAITTRNATGAWAGWLGVEKEIAERRKLHVHVADKLVQPAWQVQISQAPFGSNFLVPDLSSEYLSDDAFRMLAHLGCNGMTIYGDWLLYVKSKIFPELDHPDAAKNVTRLKDAADRAERYGISLYYVPVSPKLPSGHPVFKAHPRARGARLARGFRKEPGDLHNLCSSNDQVLAFIAETWESLFTAVPNLGGLILIIGGESYFHCFMAPDKRRLADKTPVLSKTNCVSCSKQKPEAVVSKLLGVTADAVHQSSPDAVIAAWPYSASRWSAEPYQIDLIEALPRGVSFQSEIDKDQWLHKEAAGYSKLIWDYSIDFTGPSDRVKEQAATCHGRGVPFFVKSETALGLEFIHVPYVPCIDRLAEKWTNVRSLQPRGVLQSWMFFGSFNSRAEELGWWHCWRPDLADTAILDAILKRDFGAVARHVRDGWTGMSAAMGHIPCIPPYFLGPFFLGPAHPLLPSARAKIPGVFKGVLYYKQEHEASLSSARLSEHESLVMNTIPDFPNTWGFIADDASRSWRVFLSELELAARSSKEANDAIAIAGKGMHGLDPDQQAHVKEEALLVEFMHRTLVTCFNTFTFIIARDGLGTRFGWNGTRSCREIARDELENARRARHVYEAAPWLDLAYRLEGKFPPSLSMLAEKERMLSGIIGKTSMV